MRTWIKPLLTTLVAACLTLAGWQASAADQEKVLAGRVKIDSTQLAFIVSGQAGGGVLELKGKEYPFSIGGLGVGGIGVQHLSATGQVYNLKEVSQFAGTFVQIRSGITMGTGKGVLSLSNQNGVILELKSSNEGVALSSGADGMVVTMR